MKIVRQLAELPSRARKGAVAVGNFDGVHLGHANIVAQLLARAKEVGGPAVVFTFDPHPVRLLRPEQCPPPLTWTERKAELLAKLGVDWIVSYPTDQRMLSLSARQFFDEIISEALGARAVVEGPNFYFGKNREGNVETLREFTGAAGVSLDIVEPVEIEGELVSSSRIRTLIGVHGDVATARRLLTQPYRLRGMVTHGAGRGATIGVPTANLAGIDTLLPSPGVYAGLAWLDKLPWQAAINIGPNPTFGEHIPKVEVHLIGWKKSLYGAPLEVDFLTRLREIQPFGSVELLKAQVQQDIAQAHELASAYLASGE
jgi:riboflavin kinase / FMN adenylyltransferase